MAEDIVSGQRLIVLRHGERADAAHSHKWEDPVYPYDPPLTPAGHEQAKEAGVRIKSLLQNTNVRLVCSPFLRCLQTATHVADQLKLSTIEVIPQLCDILCEHGYIYSDVRWRWCDKEIDPSLHFIDTQRYHCSPHAVYPAYPETLDSSGVRMRQALASLASDHPSETIVAICHWYTLEAALGLKTNSLEMVKAGYCACVELVTSDWSVVSKHNIS